MGIDTGADKSYRITEDNEVIFQGFYDTLEGIELKYPNGEFISLADALEELSKGEVDLRKYLIWDEIQDHIDPDYTHIIVQLNKFAFEKAIAEATKAKEYLVNNYDLFRSIYRYNLYDPLEVLAELTSLWEKGYYVHFSY